MKKKQGKKANDDDEDDEDADLVNPNRVPVKNMTISDLDAPRELTRRER